MPDKTTIPLTDGAKLAEVSREARTALSNIVGYSEILTEDLGDSNPWALSDLQNIRKASERVLDLVAYLEDQVAQARSQATIDPLTGIANRRALFSQGAALVAQGAPFAVVLIDVDHFKQVNDTYGHQVGDEVLQAIVGRTKGAVRDADLVARLAGDEFVLVLPGLGLQGARHITARVRQAISASPIHSSQGMVPVTVSMGIAVSAGGGATLEELIEQADAAMYSAKKEGRDQIAS